MTLKSLKIQNKVIHFLYMGNIIRFQMHFCICLYTIILINYFPYLILMSNTLIFMFTKARMKHINHTSYRWNVNPSAIVMTVSLSYLFRTRQLIHHPFKDGKLWRIQHVTISNEETIIQYFSSNSLQPHT